MSQTIFDTIIPNLTSGTQLSTLLNSFKDAVVSGFSGTTRPSQLQAGGYWVDTTNDGTGYWDFKIYTGTQDIVVFTLNKNTGLASISSADAIFEVQKISADSVGPTLELTKKRVAGGGQTLAADTLGELSFKGTQNDGVEIVQSKIKSVSQNNVTSTQRGSYLTFEVTTLNGSSISEAMRVVDGKVAIGNTSPGDALHVSGTGIRSEKISDDAVGAKVNVRKKRIATSGQVITNDVIGEVNFLSTTNAAAEVAAVQIEAVATQSHTSTAQGSKVNFKTKNTGTTAYVTKMTIDDNGVNAPVLITTSWQYFGDPNTNGSFRIGLSGVNLEIQVRIAGTWTSKTTFEPTIG